MSGLLASVVASRRLQPEPVATDALVHLCATSPGAASVMADLLAEMCAGATTDGLVFTGQDIDPSTDGRPDLVAADSSGVRLVVEAKFDAELTPAQVGGAYVAKLPTGIPAALVFLVPQDRMQNVWSIVSAIAGGVTSPHTLSADAVDAGLATMPLPNAGHVLAIVSWQSLLNRVGTATAKMGDVAGQAELSQLAGLVDWRTRTGWSPIAPGDLQQRTGRQLASLTDVVKASSTAVSATKTRHGGGDGGPGRYMKTPLGKSIWFGIWFGWWDRYGPGPMWAQAKAKTSKEVALLSEALAASSIKHYPRANQADVLIPILLPPGAERGATEAVVAEQLQALFTVIDAAAVEVIEDHSTS